MLRILLLQQGRPQLGDPYGQPLHGHGFYADFAQGVQDEPVAIVIAGQSDIGVGGEFRVIASLLGNVLDVIGERLGILRGGRDGKREYEAAPASAVVTEVDARGVPGNWNSTTR